MKFTLEQIRMLAECERDMDAGRQPFVRPEGTTQRMAVHPDIMAELGLVSGQTVTNTICIAITEAQIASLKAQIAMRDAGITP